MQEAILRVCGRHLTEQGVALVSYNAYPGCHLRQMVRGMAQFHVRDIDDPAEKVGQLHALVRFLADSLSDDSKVYRRILQSEAARLAMLSEPFILHDVFEDANLPVYFHEFVAQAAAHGLQYLAEALPLDPRRAEIAPALLAEFDRAGDPIAYEQHLDFLDGTAFRRTLICRDSLPLDRAMQAPPLERFLIASQAAPTAAAPDLHGDGSEEFAARKGQIAAALRCDRPIAKAALVTLFESFPRALPYATTLNSAAERLGRRPTPDDDRELRGVLLGGFNVGAIELHRWQPALADGVGVRPEASPMARYEVSQGWEATTLWHERLILTQAVLRHLIISLDGHRDREQIAADLTSAILADQLSNPGDAMRSKSEIRGEVDRQLEAALRDLARAAVLIA